MRAPTSMHTSFDKLHFVLLNPAAVPADSVNSIGEHLVAALAEQKQRLSVLAG